MSRLVLIPAAGEGSRFAKAGIKAPKPLIQVQGQTLLEHTLTSFAFADGDHLMLAVQRRHGIREAISARLAHSYPQLRLHWLELDQLLPGQLATSAAAVDALLQEQPQCRDFSLLIHNCDTGFQWSPALGQVDGLASMPVFEAEGEHWSFGQPDPQNPLRAIAIAEKRRISNLASIGLYGFRSAAQFLDRAHQQLNNGATVNGEHYIAPMLQAALEAGEQIALPRVQGVKLYGTPAELCQTFQLDLQTLIDNNRKPLNAA